MFLLWSVQNGQVVLSTAHNVLVSSQAVHNTRACKGKFLPLDNFNFTFGKKAERRRRFIKKPFSLLTS